MNDGYQERVDVQETECGGPPLTKPKRTIYFSSGETLEEEDSEEEEEESSDNGPFREPADRARLSFKKVALLIGRLSLLTCDFIGERLAGVLGLNASKYQYAIDQHHRQQQKTSRNQTGPTPAEAETMHLSHTPDRGLYGATGGATRHAVGPPDGRPADKHENKDGGQNNRGYQADGDPERER